MVGVAASSCRSKSCSHNFGRQLRNNLCKASSFFSFSPKVIFFVKQKSNTLLSWYIYIIPVLHQNINIIYQTAAKIVLTVAVGIILHLFCPQPSKRCFLPRRSRCLLQIMLKGCKGACTETFPVIFQELSECPLQVMSCVEKVR